jgi:hypothetical protein
MTDPGGDTLRLGDSWMGLGIEACMRGECPLDEELDDMDVVLLRRLLPWLSWW